MTPADPTTQLLLKKIMFIVTAFASINFASYFINRYSAFEFSYLGLIGHTAFAMMFGILVHEVDKSRSKIINTIFSIRPLKFLAGFLIHFISIIGQFTLF